jgi:hypothetical protein
VPGCRPAAGSLLGKADQRNYRFSKTDSTAIIAWINSNLEVSWIAHDEKIYASEVALIQFKLPNSVQRHLPLFNLRDNPNALRELTCAPRALRADRRRATRLRNAATRDDALDRVGTGSGSPFSS